jgi:D-beta-D-heptose 7-phosphate kinase/D-beta-D-heptose 1-phosphate adenosyltransferase
MTTALFRTIRQLSTQSSQELIIYVRDSDPNDEFIHLLSSLHEVDYIILQTESLKNLCNAIHPHEIYLLEHDVAVRLDKTKELLDSLLKQSDHFSRQTL